MTSTAVAPMASSSSSSDDSSSSPLRRFELVQTLVDHALTKSREALSTEDLVERAYGEDASVFGGTGILVGTMEDLLDNLREQVDGKIQEYFEKRTDLQEFLEDLEARLARLEQQEIQAAETEARDQDSAKQAIASTTLPAGVSLEDVIAYNKYQQGLTQREALKERLQEAKAEIARLEQEEEENMKLLNDKQAKLEGLSKTMTRSADICSMVAR